MDFIKDPVFAKSYRKHKLKVKTWEKEFKSKHNRLPSKHDIKEASADVRYSYKRYFQLKTSALEESLSQLDGDLDVSNLESFGSFDCLDTLGNTEEIGNDYCPGEISSLPTTEQLQKLLEGASGSDAPASKVWGDHLSKNIEAAKSVSTTNTALDLNSTLAQRLHSNTKFAKKPRKSLKKNCTSDTSFSTHTLEKPTQSETNDNDLNLTANYIEKLQEVNSLSMNLASSSQKIATSFKINADWLSRCDTSSLNNPNEPKSEDTVQTKYSLSNISTFSLTVPVEEPKSVNTIQTKYGLSDINISSLTVPVEQPKSIDTVQTKYGLSNINTSTLTVPVEEPKSIDTVQTKCSLSNINTSLAVPVDNPEPYFSDYVDNSESEGEGVISQVLKAKLRPALKKRKIDTEASAVSPKPKKFFKSKSNEPKVEGAKKHAKTRKKKGAKTIDVLSDAETNQPDINDYLGVAPETQAQPRFQLKTTILKDKNFIDGLASAVDIKIAPKKTTKSIKKALTDEEKLQLKIDSGTLNENFVSINIEKKVYVRGRKGRSYSTFKKQEWKKKRAALGGPDFPSAGLLTCFKCGESGHMSRYCRAHKSETLLPLTAVKDTDILPTLNDAMIAKTDEAETSTNKQYLIPESFMKLLNEPLKSTSSDKIADVKINPIYDSDVTEAPNELIAALKEFGHANFRPGQEKAIIRILSGQSTLVTLSTGSGKSLCYQLPAYLYAKRQNCITLVISPLVSLMEDQVLNMPSFLRAGCLHTNQSPTQRSKIAELIKEGALDILLVSPEAVVSSDRSSGFGGILRQLPPIAFACIDEVHCVSQWSHNFRPTYLMICKVLKEKLKVNCILGLSATATRVTMKAVIDHIGVKDGLDGVISNLPLPENLLLSVSKDRDKDRALLTLLTSEKFANFQSIIVYCIRRDVCEQVAAKIRSVIQDPGYKAQNGKKRKRMSQTAAAYHAGMSAAQRRRVQENFMSGNLRIVVATIAFGMGIDKSDVRGVVHYDMPSTFESYVQEVGRAGRDGLPAHCHVFLNKDNVDKNELLRHIYANSIERHAIRKLLQHVFVPCQCKASDNKCGGHEVAIAKDDCVAELDIPSENIMTLLCYLELHPKKYIQVLNSGYVMCKIMSYNGPQYLQNLALSCPPLAMGLAFLRKNGENSENESTVEFNVIEIAAAIGWDSGVAKYHLKNLEWEKVNGFPKKAPIRVEFNTLGYRLQAPGDLSSAELDEALDILYDRVVSQERNMLCQLEEISTTLFSKSYRSILDVISDDSDVNVKADELKDTIREYFQREEQKLDFELTERTVNEVKAVSDIRGLISAYRDCAFTGRAIARILQGVSSPNFPAIVWGRCPFWRTHLNEDFNKLAQIATQQIILMK